MKECCGTCKYSEYNRKTRDYSCNNSESDYYGCYTDYRDNCTDYEEKE